MSYIKNLLNGAAALALTFSFAACDDNNDPEGEKPEISTEEDAKEYLGETANMVLNMFNPDDQRDLARLAADFATDYEGYSVELSGSTYSGAAPRASRALGRFFTEIRKSVATGEYTNLSRAAQNALEFGLFTGVYEPDPRTRMFKRTADSDAVVVRFDHRGKYCELKVTGSDSFWTMDTYELTEGNVDAVKVPREINFALTEGSRQLIGGTLITNWADGGELVILTDVTVMNIHVNCDLQATNSNITTSESISVNDIEIVHASGEVKGRNMVTSSALKQVIKKVTKDYSYGYTETWYEIDGEKATDLFHSAEANATLIDRVRIAATAPDSKKLVGFETYFDDYDYDSDEAASEACAKACDQFNEAIPVELYLNGSTISTASLKWQPRRFDDYDYLWWEAEPVLYFADGSTYSLADYDVADFSNVENSFNSLLREYEIMFNGLF